MPYKIVSFGRYIPGHYGKIRDKFSITLISTVGKGGHAGRPFAPLAAFTFRFRNVFKLRALYPPPPQFGFGSPLWSRFKDQKQRHFCSSICVRSEYKSGNFAQPTIFLQHWFSCSLHGSLKITKGRPALYNDFRFANFTISSFPRGFRYFTN